jgi:hypothetical protein
MITLIIPFQILISNIHALLTETGICTNGNVTIGNETHILNQSAADYIKNLTKDNRLIAEMLCHSLLNETTMKNPN